MSGLKHPFLKVGEFANVVTGGTPSTKRPDYWVDGKIPWLNSGALNQKLIFSSENFITDSGLANSSTKMMPPDTVLIALTGATTGVTALLKIDACANQSVTGILPSDKHNPSYLYYYLSSIRPQILGSSYGGAQKHISQGFVKELKIPLPSLVEQQRIANILDNAANLKLQREAAISKLEILSQSVFDEMFGNLDTNEKKWKVSKFEAQFRSIRYGTGSPPEYVASGLPFIRATNIKKGGVNQKGIKLISTDSAKKIEKCKVAYGNLIIVRSGVNTGDCAVIPKELSGAYAAFDLIIDIEVKKGYFYNFLLNSRYGKRLIEPLTRRAAQPHLNADQVKGLPLIQPDDELIDIFFNRLNEIQVLIDIQKKALSKSTELFKSLENSIFYE